MSDDNPWAGVWAQRDALKADWNGYEACFSTQQEYEQFVRDVVEKIVEILQVTPDRSVLDVGCGTGRIAQGVAEYAGRVVGLDFSAPALEVARSYRSGGGTDYQLVDLNTADPSDFTGFDCAYAFGCMMYLRDHATVRRWVDALVSAGTNVLLVDLPDANIRDTRDRHYDRSRYPHLQFSQTQLSQWYPRVKILRNMFPDYINDSLRFTALITAQ